MSYEIIPSKIVKENLLYLYLADIREESRLTYKNSLNIIARYLGAADAFGFNWEQLRNEHTTMIRAWLLATRKSTTAAKMLAAVTGILGKALDLHMIEPGDYALAVKPCKVKASRRPDAATGRMLSRKELQDLLATTLGSVRRDTRDRAIILTFYFTGMRIAELDHLKCEEYEPDFMPGLSRIHIYGKGRKTRINYIGGRARDAVAAWLEVRGDDPGPLFWAIYKNDSISQDPMAITTIWKMLHDRGVLADLEPFTPHDFRRTSISNMLSLGVDPKTVADWHGHSDIKTTMRYDRRNEQRILDAIRMVNESDDRRGEERKMDAIE